MSPGAVDNTIAAIKAAYPRLKWSGDEWGIFAEGIRRLDLDDDQAEAVIRDIKRTEERYPSVALITRRLRAAAPLLAVGCSPSSEFGEPFVVAEYRRHLGLPEASALEVVCTYYRKAAARSVELRGYVRTSWGDAAIADLMQYAGQSEASAAAWALRVASEYPAEPGDEYPDTPMQVWYVEMLERAAGRTLRIHDSMVRDVRPPSRKQEAKAAWKRLRQVGDLAAIERRAMAGVMG